MPVKLIIFDLDGTLVDSLQDITNALNYGLKPYGTGRDLTAAEVAEMVGEGSLRLIEKALKKHNIEADIERLFQGFEEYYGAHLTEHTATYPGVREALEALKDRRMAMVSNKHESFVVDSVKELGLYGYFSLFVCGDTAPEKKPSPAPIHHVLKSLRVQPHEALMVGDSIVDLKSGSASSVKTVAVTYGYGKNWQHEDADFVIDNMLELVEIVRGIE